MAWRNLEDIDTAAFYEPKDVDELLSLAISGGIPLTVILHRPRV
jgi:hypothetical protein